MLRCFALTVAITAHAVPASGQPQLESIHRILWHAETEGFGGLSGLDVSENGTRFVAISDTGVLYEGLFLRNADDDLEGVTLEHSTDLVMESGDRPEFKSFRDTEGLTISEAGVIIASAENDARILTFDSATATPIRASLPKSNPYAPDNTGFEALATAPDGSLVVIPEGSATITTPYDIFKQVDSGDWIKLAEMPRSGGFKPVGADFGPDGHLYILTRAFNGFGFATRIDRLLFEKGVPREFQRIFSGQFGQFDNLEGLAVWKNPQGMLHLVAISDDNFSLLQRTEIVEFRLQE